MTKEWTEDEMRQALFGNAIGSASVNEKNLKAIQPEKMAAPIPTATKNKPKKAFTAKLRVTLRVGNEFEGQMFEIVHEVDTLSTLLAEQEATKAARKKYRYVEVVSTRSM